MQSSMELQADGVGIRAEHVLESLPDAALIIDERGELVWGNPAAEALFGVPFEQGVGPTPGDVYYVVIDKTTKLIRHVEWVEQGKADVYNLCEWAGIDRSEHSKRGAQVLALRPAVGAQAILSFDPLIQEPRDLAGVPVERMGQNGPQIEEKYLLDENGIVAVTIKNLDAGFERVFQLGA